MPHFNVKSILVAFLLGYAILWLVPKVKAL